MDEDGNILFEIMCGNIFSQSAWYERSHLMMAITVNTYQIETTKQNITNLADVALPAFVRLSSYGEATAIFAEFDRVITTKKISSGSPGKGGSLKLPLLVFREIQTRPSLK